MRAIVRAGVRTKDGTVFPFSSDIPPSLRKKAEDLGIGMPTSAPITIGSFSVTNPVTKVTSRVPVSLVQGDRAAGRYTTEIVGERRTSKADRKARAVKAIGRLCLKLPAKKIDELADMLFSFNERREIVLNVPSRPLKLKDLSTLRAVLAHELTHAADEGARRHRIAQDKKMQLLDDIDVISDELKLGEYIPTKRERIEAASVGDTEWSNDPREVTAMLNEIATEIGDFDSAMDSFRFSLRVAGRPEFKSRDRELIAFLRWQSPTFREVSSEWTPKSLKRVLRSIWDRYHTEKKFPKATGVLKNRRTSRRTSRRRTSRRSRT